MRKLTILFAFLTLSAGLWADELEDAKADAIAKIEDAIDGVSDEDIFAIANTAIDDINAATTQENLDAIKTLAIAKINALVLIQTARQGIQNKEINDMIDDAANGIKSTTKVGQIEDKLFNAMTIIGLFLTGKEEGDAIGYDRGKEEGYNAGKAEVLGEMGTPRTSIPAVKVTKGEKVVILYAPEKVEMIKIPANN